MRSCKKAVRNAYSLSCLWVEKSVPMEWSPSNTRLCELKSNNNRVNGLNHWCNVVEGPSRGALVTIPLKLAMTWKKRVPWHIFQSTKVICSSFFLATREGYSVELNRIGAARMNSLMQEQPHVWEASGYTSQTLSEGCVSKPTDSKY